MILMPVGFLKDIVNMLAGTIHKCRQISSDAFGLQVGMQGTIEIVSIIQQAVQIKDPAIESKWI